MACELARHQVPVRIIDKNSAASSWSKALAIFPRTLEVFEAMGVVESFVQAGKKLESICIHNLSGELARVGFEDLASPYRFVLSLPQSETERLLIHHLESSLGISVERDTELLDLTQTPDVVTATLQHDDGAIETVHTPWCIGCDGAHSAVRHALGLEFAGEAYHEVFVLADLNVRAPLSGDKAHLFFCTDGVMAYFPFGHGRGRIIANLSSAEIPRNEEPNLDLVRSLVSQRGLPDAELSDLTWSSLFHISRRKVEGFQHGRVFLAGDAAHIHSPAGGQGMNTGIQDAFNLGWKLGLVANGESQPSLLESYNPEREPIARTVLKMTDRLTRLATAQSPIVQQIRDLVLPLITGIEAVEGYIAERLAELAINYRNSPIVENHGAHWLHAGDRAPDGNLKEPHTGRALRVFEVLREAQQHVLFVFEGTDEHPGVVSQIETVREEFTRCFGPLLKVHLVRHGVACPDAGPEDLLDETGLVHQAYGTVNGGLILIRPDWYIGCRADLPREEELWEHLEKLFPGHRTAMAERG
jgi:2-polyprenyl-6-methoxyphenol hydroxylase-like FAD-dependent oxidoreductase